MTPNRIVAIVTAALSLAAAFLPVLANLDWTSTAGIFAGLISLNAVALKWLDGWQKHEARQYEMDPTVAAPKPRVKRRVKVPGS